MSFTRHLLVDGANILNAWPETRALLPRDRDAARSQLIHRLAAIHDAEQVRVTVVFDGRGTELVIERPSDQTTYSVLYTPSSLTADDVIEQIVANATEAAVCRVATDDVAQRETVQAAGGETMSSGDLLAWAQRAANRQTTVIDQLRDANKREWRAQ